MHTHTHTHIHTQLHMLTHIHTCQLRYIRFTQLSQNVLKLRGEGTLGSALFWSPSPLLLLCSLPFLLFLVLRLVLGNVRYIILANFGILTGSSQRNNSKGSESESALFVRHTWCFWNKHFAMIGGKKLQVQVMLQTTKKYLTPPPHTHKRTHMLLWSTTARCFLGCWTKFVEKPGCFLGCWTKFVDLTLSDLARLSTKQKFLTTAAFFRWVKRCWRSNGSDAFLVVWRGILSEGGNISF